MEMRLFVHAAEQGSLSKAAEILNIPNSSASRGLASIEKRLGVRLVDRTTRNFALTELGEIFYQQCQMVLATVEEAEASLHAARVEIAGVLRITGSTSFCLKHIVPVLPTFTEKHPKVDVPIMAANRYYDLIDNGIDVAFQVRDYTVDSNIIVRPLARARLILAAAPSYIERHGAPASVHDLAHHKILMYSYHQDRDGLQFTCGKETVRVEVKRHLEATDGRILTAAALLGQGIVVQPNYVLHDDIVAGRVVTVLPDWRLPEIPINIAYQRRKFLPKKTTAFIDFIVQHFREMDFERQWEEGGGPAHVAVS